MSNSKDFWENIARQKADREARAKGINPNNYSQDIYGRKQLENEIEYGEKSKKKISHKITESYSATSSTRFPFSAFFILLFAGVVIIGMYYSNKSQFSGNRNGPLSPRDIEMQEKLKKTLEKKSYLYNAPDYSKNQLLISLEGKKFNNWAEGLQKYATKNRNYDAAFYRDIADSTEFYAPYSQQEMFLRLMWGLDENGNAKLTRQHVREVREKYSSTNQKFK